MKRLPKKTPLNSEIGHKYFSALRNGVATVEELYLKGTNGIPPVISNLSIEASLNNFPYFPTVFLIGRVYKTETVKDGVVTEYKELDNWREFVQREVCKAGYIPLDGVAFDLHEEDVVAGAGRAFFHAYISPLGIVDGRSRLGIGSIEEAKFILSLGGNIGFIVNENEYDQVKRFLEGKSTKYPDCLPAYYGVLDLEPEDIIKGIKGVSSWLQAQHKKLNYKVFKDRFIPKKVKTIIDYYSLYYASYREKDLNVYHQILKLHKDKCASMSRGK